MASPFSLPRAKDEALAPPAVTLTASASPSPNTPPDVSPATDTDGRSPTSAAYSTADDDEGDGEDEDVKPDVKPAASRKKRAKKESEVFGPPRLIDHLSNASEEAHKTFVPLQTNHHQFKTLGRSNQEEESMICDCSFRAGIDDEDQACGPSSDCINRLTQVECLESECRSRSYCKNQRFSKAEYADIEVVLTERKGYGLRAASDIRTDAFIYEYIGEVVQRSTFMKRMREYAAEGIRHFYFMMLQKDEYLDATKKGGIGRFANHSCNPNCYVAKWVVGKRMRMGIFAKRDILKGEELTFNYNVDRYGHDAQPCFCEEPNCVGSIGGKTQTDVGGMDDLYLDALGITEEVEALGLKGNKKRRGKKLGEDFMPKLRPIEEDEVTKVVPAIRQATANRSMLCHLLNRIKMTTEPVVQRRIMRMHGFALMTTVLKELPEDKEVVKLVLESISEWQLVNRNKIEDSKIEAPVRACLEEEDQELKSLAERLLTGWSELPTAYRIPRRPIYIPDAEDDANRPEGPTDSPSKVDTPIEKSNTNLPLKHITTAATAISTPVRSVSASLFQTGSSTFVLPTAAPVFRPSILSSLSSHSPSSPAPPPQPAAPATPTAQEIQLRLQARLDQAARDAQAQAEAQAAAAALALKGGSTSSTADRLRERERGEKRKRSSLGGHSSSSSSVSDHHHHRPGSSAAGSSSTMASKSSTSGSTPEERKEKKLRGMLSELVVKTLSKYKDKMDHERFKKSARECTDLIVSKERRRPDYAASSTVAPLSEETANKVRKFTKEYAHKILKKIEADTKRRAERAAAGQPPEPALAAGVLLPMAVTPGSGTPAEEDVSMDWDATGGTEVDDGMVDLYGGLEGSPQDEGGGGGERDHDAF